MRSMVTIALACCIFTAVCVPAEARKPQRRDYRIQQPWSRDEFAADLEALPGDLFPPLFTSAAVDTYCIVRFGFEQMNWQGWTQRDMTAQRDTFSHVDDFSGLGGGAHGGLVALEGTQSMWCGARDWDHQVSTPYWCPGDFEYLCGWVAAPGYGNDWDQMLTSEVIFFQGPLTFSYHGYFDSEPDHDRTVVEYDSRAGDWVELAVYDGTVDTVAVHELLLGQAATKLRFHFTSDGAWSDEDGLWDTDGAFIVDEITISDTGGMIDYEDFESYSVCASDTRGAGGLWYGDVAEPYGARSMLANNLADEDPCNDNLATQIIFIYDPWWPEPEPGLPPTPFCMGPGGIEAPCQHDAIISPIINMNMYSSNCDEVQDTPIPPGDLSDLGGAILGFTIYRDLPYENLVGYNWAVRTIDEITGCPGPWQDRGFYTMGAGKEYYFEMHEIGDLVDGGPIQVGLFVRDLCDLWYEVYGDCEEHTSSPWFDNVYVKRYSNVGPQWSWRDLDLFQDNFPEEEFNMGSYVRADAANDLRPNDDPVIDPGDSIVVTCTSPLAGGLDTTPDGWPRVYLHAHCDYIGSGTKPDLYGAPLAGNYGRYYSDDGEWTILQCGYARTSAGNISPDKYMVDLNDSLFTRGYRIVYYFKAYDMHGRSSTLPARAEQFPWPPTGWQWPITLAWKSGPYFFEWTCLPTLKSDILYVDDFHGRGVADGIAQYYWHEAFYDVIWIQPDRYDVNSPTSRVSNGPGSRAKNYHMTTAYRTVIWDSGNLSECTISEGTEYSDKSNDAQMLVDWMEFSPHRVGLWVCGDDIAQELGGAPSGVALTLLTAYCGVQYVGNSYYELSGIVNPFVKADNNVDNPLWRGTYGDSFYVFGGCPSINRFDYLEKTGYGEYALDYPDVGGLPYYAGIYSQGTNDGGYPIRTMWFGFSFMYMRDVTLSWIPMRWFVCRDVLTWMETDVGDPFDVGDIPAVNSLAQNFPNPFNPTTMVNFSVKAKGRVTLRIYDVAGRLVRTLVDEVREPGRYKIEWDGANNRGTDVASGVYFYRMEVPGFVATRKMVMLR